MMRPSLRDSDMRAQGAQRTPRTLDVRVWAVIIVIIAAVTWAIVWLT
jgi:hypothetical protein